MGTTPHERAAFIAGLTVREAMESVLQDDYSLDLPDRRVTREHVDRALIRIIRLGEYFWPERPKLARGIGGYGEGLVPILGSLELVHDAESERVAVYRRGREAEGALFTVPSRVLVTARDTYPEPPFTADEDEDDG
jgi:hypothetical protein